VTIGNRYDDKPFDAPRIGNRVNIGVGATLLGLISVGDDVNIGAHSIVLEDVPAWSTVAGPKATIRPRRAAAPVEHEPVDSHANVP
jgi:serine O-acetyltransferase